LGVLLEDEVFDLDVVDSEHKHQDNSMSIIRPHNAIRSNRVQLVLVRTSTSMAAGTGLTTMAIWKVDHWCVGMATADHTAQSTSGCKHVDVDVVTVLMREGQETK
jgi:hypothetical protein